jgi:antirestriction protein
MPRFYAACLASYNAGTLHGAWIDASDDVDTMQEEISAMLRASPHPNILVEDPATGEEVPSAEEYAVHEYDGLPSSLGEHPGLDYIAAYVELLETADDRDIPEDVVAELVEGSDLAGIDRAKDAIDDDFQGRFDSLEAWAYDFEDTSGGLTDVPDRFHNYIDFAAIGRDAEIGGDIRAIRSGGSLYVFWNR